MCGICGVLQVGGEPRPVVDVAVLNAMTDAMTHRGPDDRGTYVADGVALGARRLSIIDVERGHQPISNEDGTVWAVQNGELYNHDAVREALRADGHRFTSRCDTEILPHLYERDGAAFCRRLRGKFGIAVWDARRRCAVLARDRLGVKPLYYAVCGDLVVFGSELKSVLASGLVPLEIDLDALDAYLTFGFVPGPSTLLRHVSKLLPGHRLLVGAGEVRLEEYWAFPPPRPSSDGRADVQADALLDVLDEAVRLRLMSDVPIGAMLSGGLDSSLVVALMARHSSRPVETFSVGFVEAGRENELADARFVASELGTNHHELELSFHEQEIDLPQLVWHLDEPLADLSTLGFLALSRLAAEHVTVALSGQGADELLGGYARHRHAALAGRWLRLPGPIRSAGVGAGRIAGGRLGRAAEILAAPDAVGRQLRLRTPFLDAGQRATLVRGPLLERDGAARAAVERRARSLGGDVLADSLYLDAQLGLVDEMLHYFDRAGMAHSLEVRVPFLDHRVVEHCATVPSALKVRGMTTKHVLRLAARGLVPDRIIDKPKVGFFNGVAGAWFRAQTDGLASELLLAPDARYTEYVDRAGVQSLLRAHAAGAGRAGPPLLALLMLEVWLSTYLPRAASLGAAEHRLPAVV